MDNLPVGRSLPTPTSTLLTCLEQILLNRDTEKIQDAINPAVAVGPLASGMNEWPWSGVQFGKLIQLKHYLSFLFETDFLRGIKDMETGQSDGDNELVQ